MVDALEIPKVGPFILDDLPILRVLVLHIGYIT